MIKYFCDACDTEVPEDEGHDVEVGVTDRSEIGGMEKRRCLLCAKCYTSFTRHIKVLLGWSPGKAAQ